MSQPESFPPAARSEQSPSGAAPRTTTLSPVTAASPAGAAGSTAADSAPAGSGAAGKKPRKTIAGPRRVRLALTRVDPWSVMKVVFLLSVACGIILVVASAVVWFMLDAMHVFSKIQELAGTVFSSSSNAFTALLEYMKFSRAISIATVIGVFNVILATALAPIAAFLYNVTATLVGGVHLTLADE